MRKWWPALPATAALVLWILVSVQSAGADEVKDSATTDKEQLIERAICDSTNSIEYLDCLA